MCKFFLEKKTATFFSLFRNWIKSENNFKSGNSKIWMKLSQKFSNLMFRWKWSVCAIVTEIQTWFKSKCAMCNCWNEIEQMNFETFKIDKYIGTRFKNLHISIPYNIFFVVVRFHSPSKALNITSSINNRSICTKMNCCYWDLILLIVYHQAPSRPYMQLSAHSDYNNL